MTIRAWRSHGARSNNLGTPADRESPRKDRIMGPLARLHHRCVGCETQGPPGGSNRRFMLNGRSEDRRRLTRRIGAAAALERTAMRSALREAVPNEVQAGSAGALARVPRAMRAAVRRVRRSRRCTHVQHGAAARDAEAPDRGPGQAPRSADGERSEPEERARREARARRTVPSQHRLRESNGPHRHRSDGAARDALRTMQRP